MALHHYLLFVALLCALQETQAGEGDPTLQSVGLVHSKILALEIRTGIIQPGIITTYSPLPGDVFINFEAGGIWLLRADLSQYILVPQEGGTLNATKSMDVKLGDDLNTAWSDLSTSYQLLDHTTSSNLQPVQVSRKSKPTQCGRIKFDSTLCTTVHRIYLTFNTPLVSGRTYTINFMNNPHSSSLTNEQFSFNGTCAVFHLTLTEDNLWTEAIHINLAGYRTDSDSKRALVSIWRGSGGGVNYNDTGVTFRIVDASNGSTVLSGSATFRKSSGIPDDALGSNLQKADVWEINFNQVRTPGRYRVVVPGVGCSNNFDITENMWLQLFKLGTKDFYYQRSGTELVTPYSFIDRPRPQYPPTMKKQSVWSNATLLYTSMGPISANDGSDPDFPSSFTELPAHATTEPCNTYGGYMDAGDWDRRAQHLIINYELFALYELNSTFWNTINLDIPESSNSLADIVDVALWNVDFYAMGQRSDGGVSGGVESNEHPIVGQSSWESTQPWFCYAPDPWVTYFFAASAAQASRILQPINATLATSYRNKAVLAWNWGEANRISNVPAGSVRFTTLVNRYINDARNLASIELYRLTGNTTYHQVFLQTTYFTTVQPEVFAYDSYGPIFIQGDAAWSYAKTTEFSVNSTLQSNCRQSIINSADGRVAAYNYMGFAFAKFPYMAFGFSTSKLYEITRSYYLTASTTDKKMYFDITESSMAFGLGANPDNVIYTAEVPFAANDTNHIVHHNLHVDSMLYNLHPPPGQTQLGPSAPSVPTYCGVEYFYPNNSGTTLWPANENWADIGLCSPMLTEFSVSDVTVVVSYNWGWLAMMTEQATPVPSISPSPVPSTSPAVSPSHVPSTAASPSPESEGDMNHAFLLVVQWMVILMALFVVVM